MNFQQSGLYHQQVYQRQQEWSQQQRQQQPHQQPQHQQPQQPNAGSIAYREEDLRLFLQTFPEFRVFITKTTQM